MKQSLLQNFTPIALVGNLYAQLNGVLKQGHIYYLDINTLNSSKIFEISLLVNKNSSGEISAEAGLSDRDDTSTQFFTAYE